MWVPMSLISATTLLLVLRHFYYVGRHVAICASAPLFSTVLYLRVPIVLCPSHSFIVTGLCRQILIYCVHEYMIYGNNNMKTKVISSNAKTYLSSVL